MTLMPAVRRAGLGRPRHISRGDGLEHALARFPVSLRSRVAALAAGHPYLADTARSFPALLAALASEPHWAPRREVARRLIVSGRPLREAAAALDLPMWLRKLPPDAFPGRPPLLPKGNDFACRVANLVPKPCAMAAWLADISLAWLTGGEAYAIWVAEHHGHPSLRRPRLRGPRRHRRPALSPVPVLAVFAWHSLATDAPAAAFIARPWHTKAAPDETSANAWAWFDRLELEFGLGPDGLRDVWLLPRSVDGFDFVPLATARDVTDEAVAMKNCVGELGCGLGSGWFRLWSIRRDGERVATLRIDRNEGLDAPILTDLKGPGNVEAPAAVWRATYHWLARQPAGLIPTGDIGEVSIDRAQWQRMWLPYWRAMGFKPWLPVSPRGNPLDGLTRCLCRV